MNAPFVPGNRPARAIVVGAMCAWACAGLAAQVAAAEPLRPPAEPVQSAAIGPAWNELDELVAPIALYPDALLAQVLPAATRPLQIVQATRYLERQGGSVEELPETPWDPAVTALLHFPGVLNRMNDDLDWTIRLGDAVVARQPDVMDAIQRVRHQARAVGNLGSNDKQTVVVEQEVIRIAPATPRVIYVPEYDPDVIVVRRESVYVAPVVTFGLGLAIGWWFADDYCDWHHHRVYHHGRYYGHGSYGSRHRRHGAVHHDRGHRRSGPSRSERGVRDHRRAQVAPSVSRRGQGAGSERSRAGRSSAEARTATARRRSEVGTATVESAARSTPTARRRAVSRAAVLGTAGTTRSRSAARSTGRGATLPAPPTAVPSTTRSAEVAGATAARSVDVAGSRAARSTTRSVGAARSARVYGPSASASARQRSTFGGASRSPAVRGGSRGGTSGRRSTAATSRGGRGRRR